MAERAKHYGDLADDVQDAWRPEFLNTAGSLTAESQANYVRGLAFGLILDRLRVSAASRRPQGLPA